jgi:hypothetical protein
MTADFISRMVTISITAEAFAAIEAILPKGTKGVRRPESLASILDSLHRPCSCLG